MAERVVAERSQDPTDDLWQAIYSQRAIRHFKPDPVAEDMLLSIMEAATKAPSGSNTQAWAFLIVQDAAKRAAMAGFLRSALEADADFQERFARVDEIEDPSQRRMLQGARGLLMELDKAPVLLVPCLHHPDGPAPQGVLAGSSIYGAIQNLQLAARAHGLGTVLTTFQRSFEPELRDLLAIPETARPVALIPLGYPDGWFGPTRRRPVEEVIHIDGWGNHPAG